jgi:Tfp pilus assembly protein PilF
MNLQEGLIAWSIGNLATTEDKFRQVIATEPNSEAAHHYLALLLRAAGDTQGAAAEEKAERISRRFDTKAQDLAVVLFWVDPVKGGVTRRL